MAAGVPCVTRSRLQCHHPPDEVPPAAVSCLAPRGTSLPPAGCVIAPHVISLPVGEGGDEGGREGKGGKERGNWNRSREERDRRREVKRRNEKNGKNKKKKQRRKQKQRMPETNSYERQTYSKKLLANKSYPEAVPRRPGAPSRPIIAITIRDERCSLSITVICCSGVQRAAS